ncbi:MAG TPA: DUF4340 domain-containing protein, partial [Myxococcaceae bacterium]|nr:DUF4340 domain-containing protein [Myxococcaceae bacterium]
MTPQQKNLVTLGGLLVAVGGLGLYAYFGVMKPSETEIELKASDEKLFRAYAPGTQSEDGGEPADPVFTGLTLRTKGETTRLEKRRDGWWVVAPVQAKAEQFAVDTLTSQLRSGKFKRVVEEHPTDADLARYGLKAPAFSVSAQAYLPDPSGGDKDDPSRKREVTLQGGIENTFDGSVYLRREGDPKVYSVEGGVRLALEKTSFDLRDKEVLSL